jgi:hypothetical protein
MQDVPSTNTYIRVHGVHVLLGCGATSLVIGSSFPDVPPATEDTNTIFHFLHSATSSHLTAWQEGSNNPVVQRKLIQKRVPQLHRCESLKFPSMYVIHCPSIRPSVAPCISKSKNPIEKLTKISYSLYTGKLRTVVNADITLMAKTICLDRVN